MAAAGELVDKNKFKDGLHILKLIWTWGAAECHDFYTKYCSNRSACTQNAPEPGFWSRRRAILDQFLISIPVSVSNFRIPTITR